MLSINEQYSEIFKGISEGKVIQYFNHSSYTWLDADVTQVLTNIIELYWLPGDLRVKTSTIRIGSYDVPEPMRVAPTVYTEYYFPMINMPSRTFSYPWTDDKVDFISLQAGLCHLTREAAEIHAKALLSFTAVNPL